MCVPKLPLSSVIELGCAFQTMLPVSQGTQSFADEAKPEAQATSQTNLGTGMRTNDILEIMLMSEFELTRIIFYSFLS
jgi:hypothetical protein